MLTVGAEDLGRSAHLQLHVRADVVARRRAVALPHPLVIPVKKIAHRAGRIDRDQPVQGVIRERPAPAYRGYRMLARGMVLGAKLIGENRGQTAGINGSGWRAGEKGHSKESGLFSPLHSFPFHLFKFFFDLLSLPSIYKTTQEY